MHPRKHRPEADPVRKRRLSGPVRGLICILLLAEILALAACTDRPALDDDVAWLHQEAHRLIRASARTMSNGVTAFPPQVGLGYEAFWLRDYAYTLEGAIDAYSDEELIDAAGVFVGGIGPDGAGVDRVNFDGTPLYRPGGGGDLGEHPVTDGGPFTVAVAWFTFQRTKDRALLTGIIDDLIRTMEAVPRNPENGLVHIRPGGHDRCPYGFTDTVKKQGDVLFSSLLLVEAERRLADLLDAAGRDSAAAARRDEAARLTQGIRETFWNEDIGLFDAASEVCRQPDIWGSSFAVYLGVADSSQSVAVARYIADHYGEIVQKGQVRHLPGGTYWESVLEGMQRDQYQNGGYWATPVGWFVYALDLVDSDRADQTIRDMVADFRERGVCEWVFEETCRLPGYLASAALPLAGIRAMMERRTRSGRRSAR